MSDTKFRLWQPLMLGAAMSVLAACGGSGGDAPATDTTAESSADSVADTAAAAAGDAADAAEDAAADVAEATEDAATAAAEEAAEVVEDVEAAAADAADAVEDAVEDAAADTAAAGSGNDLVTAEVAAQYQALTGDAAQGRRVFTKCMSCHVVQEGQNRVGPSLYGLVGRTAGTVERFRYSDANASSGVVWTEEALFAYLERPTAFIPGTIMAFPGLPDPQERADVIAYIKEESS